MSELPIEAVRLPQPKQGDVVVFHMSGLTMMELEEFDRQLQPLRGHCPGVMFLVAERVDDITVVRPESVKLPHDASECARLGCLPETEGHRDGD